ncbi:hypothetical protein CO009_00445 [Candidatus Shapirobacteria bacterium CG_4_8_14_3_um_filter_35_11]|uniref:Gas vesicle protein n=4 Tax=Candidatus Shapironibacteriota TaxID=1752721 RepID=A0A2M7XNJ8_9BACT|nr:MAG: hypothetical protein COZ41_01000 [Candidatus Shapirobacteria bacterium CG_4_10_14_3_um_filter_35_13]PJA50982.1 MAG: hypothetical protein CO168_02185 [Candidatus Shapirobacteria bacterium CG_4_9_14_3_um_filter_36_12]PJC81082.1 MAG: hypothetical protein CO009_00445 [Candidatus Shapirobacteria bacterium CG_4_8_14_3_um_filter_35_11]PJE66647.1 MAG: hypothetical protein COU93_03190 [Candidatus Shapirobacteria bacterium CG10_big_fil_rev_8_21_14_0_10_36_6]
MSNENEGSNSLIFGFLGLVAGTIGGILLAPKTGSETREEMIKKIRDIFGIYSTEFREKFEKIREVVEKRLIALKKAGSQIDNEKYMEVVDEVITDFKSDINTTKDGFEKLAKYLKKDWEKIKKTLA